MILDQYLFQVLGIGSGSMMTLTRIRHDGWMNRWMDVLKNGWDKMQCNAFSRASVSFLDLCQVVFPPIVSVVFPILSSGCQCFMLKVKHGCCVFTASRSSPTERPGGKSWVRVTILSINNLNSTYNLYRVYYINMLY